MINPYSFPKSSRLATQPTSSAIFSQKSYWLLNINEITSIGRSLVLLLGLSITVASTFLLSAFSNTAVAQTIEEQQRTVPGEQTISQVNVLFVNPSVGDDKAGNGSERTPFKTIRQALHVAAPNSTIILATGTYSEQSGEVFPLILKPGVSIKGDASTKGRGIVIQGGDDYLSRTFGKQNAAIVTANSSSIVGVTIMNPKPRGYGVLIESTNPTISENTFAGSTQDGISITGNATPVISKNYFYQNKANGLTVSGFARPQIRENIFQQTGFGINIAQNAEPLIIGNQIQSNRAGIIVQASSRPKLRNNAIQNNREDGLVVIAQAVPDLGSATEPGGNDFRNNARYDINAGASKQLFSAYGNTIASNRIAGKVDMSGNTTSIATAQSVSTPTASTNEITFTAPNVPQTVEQLGNQLIPSPTTNLARNTRLNNTPVLSRLSSRQTRTVRNNSVNQGLLGSIGSSVGNTANIVTGTLNGTLNSQLTPLQPINSLGTVRAPQPNVLTPLQKSNFPAPGGLTATQPITPQTTVDNTPQINYVRINPQTIEFAAPSEKLAATPQQMPLQPIQTVPPIDVPTNGAQLGNPSNIVQMPTNMMAPLPNQSSLIASANSLRTQIATASTNVRYRVLVPTSSERDEDIIRFLAPGAFRTTIRGQAAIQVGVFSNTFNAEQMLRVLNNNGLKGMIEPLN